MRHSSGDPRCAIFSLHISGADCSQIDGILRAVQHALADSSHHVSDAAVLDVVESSTLTAYDAEFVALAQGLSVPLVTADKAVLKAFPDRALTMQAFAGRG